MAETLHTGWPEAAEIVVDDRMLLDGSQMLFLKAPFETSRDGSGLLGRTLVMDGDFWMVKGVEHDMLAFPMIQVGEPIALSLAPL